MFCVIYICIQLLQLGPILCNLMDHSPQAPLSVGFSQQEYWSRLSLPPPRDLSDWGIELLSSASPALQTDSLLLSHQGSCIYIYMKKVKEKKVKSLNCVLLFVTSWTIAYQASPSMGFSRQEYWNGLPFPSPRDLPDPRILPASPALAGGIFILITQCLCQCKAWL